jgi:hypothetical protein
MLNNFWGLEGRSCFGHSDSSCQLEKLLVWMFREHSCVGKEDGLALRPPLICDSSGRVSNLPVFGSLMESSLIKSGSLNNC